MGTPKRWRGGQSKDLLDSRDLPRSTSRSPSRSPNRVRKPIIPTFGADAEDLVEEILPDHNPMSIISEGSPDRRVTPDKRAVTPDIPELSECANLRISSPSDRRRSIQPNRPKFSARGIGDEFGADDDVESEVLDDAPAHKRKRGTPTSSPRVGKENVSPTKKSAPRSSSRCRPVAVDVSSPAADGSTTRADTPGTPVIPTLDDFVAGEEARAAHPEKYNAQPTAIQANCADANQEQRWRSPWPKLW
eukprot:Rmarinus@m.7785